MDSTNPFLAAAAINDASKTTYRMVKSGTAVAADEVEDASIPAVEVMVSWGDTVLHVAHLTPPRSFFIGENEEEKTGYRMPTEKLGADRLPLVIANGSEIAAVVPMNAKGSIQIGEERISLADARSRGLLTSCNELAGAEQVALVKNARARIELEGFAFQVSAVAAGKKPPKQMSKGKRAGIAFLLGSGLVHLGIVGALMMSPGNSLDEDNAGLDKPTQAYIAQLQKNTADKEIAEQQTKSTEGGDVKPGGTGEKHNGPEGMAGANDKPATKGYYTIKGPADTKEQRLAKVHALIESNSYGAVGALSSVFGAKPNEMVVFDGGDETIGKAEKTFNGNILGDHPGDSFGYNGMGLTNTGPGGGGWMNGAGLGKVGGFGNGDGTGDGVGWGPGSGTKPGIPRKPSMVKPIETDVSMVGKLPPETVKRIIRANFPRFRQCYDLGLKKDPGLKGVVTVRFIIDNTGGVETASVASSTLSDGAVTSCVVGVYRTLSFPEPEGGKVMVSYPIDFQSGE